MASDNSGQLYWSKVGGRKTLNSRGQLGKEPPPTGDPTQGHPTSTEANIQPPLITISTTPATVHDQESGSGPAAAPDPLQPWRIDLPNSRPPSRTSTPQGHPDQFDNRRSLEHSNETTTTEQGDDDLVFGTPANQALLNDAGIRSNPTTFTLQDIPKDITEDQLSVLIETLDTKIEIFGADFRNQEGWKSLLKSNSANLKTTTQSLITNAKNIKSKHSVLRLYGLQKTLDNHIRSLNQIADTETQAQGSPFVFRPSSLGTPSNHTTETIHQSLENLGGESSTVGRESVSDTEDPTRAAPQRMSWKRVIGILETKVKSLEIRKADLSTQHSLVEAVNNKATKKELSDACYRICQLEASTDIHDIHATLCDHQQAIEGDKAECENLFDGLFADTSRLEFRMESAMELIDNLRSEVEELKNQARQSRPHTQNSDIILGQPPAEIHPPPTSYRPPSVSGISAFPTRTSSNLLTTTNQGYMHTAFTMSRGGIRPSPAIVPSAFQRPVHSGNNHDLPTQTTVYCQEPFHPINTSAPVRPQVPQPGTNTNIHTAPDQQGTYQRSRGPPLVTNSSVPAFINLYDSADEDEDAQSFHSSASAARSDRSSTTEDCALNHAEYLIKTAKRALLEMLDPPINNKLTKTVVQGLLKSIVPAVDAERKDLQGLINSYAKEVQTEYGHHVLRRGQEVVQKARKWALGMRAKYNELDCAKKPLDAKLFEGLKRFTATSDINIFEFLAKFEAFTEEKGTPKERATLLYESYLQKEIQMMLIAYREDYQKMRTWLITRFGDVKVMTDNILRCIINDRIPSDITSSVQLTDYYRKLDSVFKRIQELKRTTDMPVTRLKNYIYSTAFLEKLAALLPERASFKFLESHSANNQDLYTIEGNKAFHTMANVVAEIFYMNETKTRMESSTANQNKKPQAQEENNPKKRNRGAHAADVQDKSDEDDQDKSAHFQRQPPKPKSSVQQKKSSPKESDKSKQENRGKQNNKPKFNFPCPLHSTHELGSCKEFFKANPHKRYRSIFRRNCSRCLGPIWMCKGQCDAKVPKIFLCPECTTYADQNNRITNNILVCGRKDHSKPDEKDLLEPLKKYFTSFDPKEVQGKISLTAHLRLSAHTAKCSKATLTSKPDDDREVPIINTCSGELVHTTEDNIIQESTQDAFYIMQILNLRGQDVLTFFDSGANSHLIDGSLAEDIDLKVLKEDGVNIQVVGGQKIWSNYGTYALTLGPTEDEFFHQLSAQGVGVISDAFDHYDLKEINQEVKKSGKLNSEYKALPKYIGGQPPKLLLGIKDTGLQPELLFQLPSGLGVYRSQLKDKFGSRICYGGPHEAFTKVNKSNGTHFNQVNAFFMNMASQIKTSPYSSIAHSLNPDYEDTGFGVMIADYKNTKKSFISYESHILPSSVTDDILSDLDVDPPDNDTIDDKFCACEPIYNTPSGMNELGNLPKVHKAKVPVSKRKEYFDEEDQSHIANYRCEDCLKCKKCSLSDRSKMMSLQEKMEQEAIEKSVHINLEERKVYVDLPFIKPPVEALRKRHHANSNFKQALKIYQSQCRKPQPMRQAMVKVHEDLIQRGFMKKITELSTGQQNLIKKAEFNHYMPWNIAEKPESTSTPVRMVVDASITGLNEILAKGENKMSKINNILIRNRCRKYIWTSDISKLYNQLHLNDSALPYTLFLFSDNLNTTDQPEVYVMTRAWYGVSPTGNQSTEALTRLTSLLQEQYPLASPVVRDDLYVDDTITGSNEEPTALKQIKETLSAFSQGGFALKYVVRSGSDPPEEASTDGTSLKILGYKWSPKEDILNPGFGEINFNKKRRGAKKPNPFTIETPEDVSRLLNATKITRRMIVSKIAEIWDPVGIWEPYKLQLKLDNSYLNGLDWDVPVSCELQTHWKDRFREFVDIPKMEAIRCVIPQEAIDPNSMRLLCLSDAAESAGGCAIYASFQKVDGSFSCQLLTSRSKLMNQKIPRNELEAIKLMAETANTVKKALGDQVKDVLYFTDSTIAMCWCHNTSKKLRMYTLYRVADIRRNILGTAYDTQELPLYHIDGKLNIADYLTKHHNIKPEDMAPQSLWHTGHPWMNLSLEKMPLTTYKQLTISKEELITIDQECFPEPIMSEVVSSLPPQVMYSGTASTLHCTRCEHNNLGIPLQQCYGIDNEFDHCDDCSCPIQFSSFALKAGKTQHELLDLISLGWSRSLTRLSFVAKFATKLKHRTHINKGISTDSCIVCKISNLTTDPIEQDKIFTTQAKDYLFRQETARIKTLLPKKKIDQFTEKDGILYYESRLSEENQITQTDLDIDIFIDSAEIKTMLPVVLADSELFFSYTLHVHHKIRPHSGVEITLKEINKSMMVLNNPRRIIQMIRKFCPRCRIIAKKTVELRMMHHPAARTNLAPPFYHCMVDTVFGFKGQPYKNARKSFKMYALIIVCLLTGATNILAIEGLETQDIIQALERHSARHGVPAVMYVDNGTQLMALEHAHFNLRNLKAHVLDSLGLKIIVSNAKSHEERGRVEAKVKLLRSMLDKLTISNHSCMTALQWETLFAKISNMLDDLPLAKCTNSNLADPTWDIITANRLKLGRNNNRSLEGYISLPKGVGPDSLLKRNQEIQKVWYQMLIDRIHHLIPRPAKWSKTDDVNVGDICLFIYNENPGMGKYVWKIGKVTDTSKENSVIISYPGPPTAKGKPTTRSLSRCPRTISIISAAGDIDLNSRKFYETNICNNKY